MVYQHWLIFLFFFERKCRHKKWEDPSSTDSFYFVARSVTEDHGSTLLELQYLVWRLYGYGQNHGSVLGFIWCYTEIAVKSISHWYEQKQTYFHCWRPHFDWWDPCLLLLINYPIHNLSTFLLKTPVWICHTKPGCNNESVITFWDSTVLSLWTTPCQHSMSVWLPSWEDCT